jgi:hypothetical protein
VPVLVGVAMPLPRVEPLLERPFAITGTWSVAAEVITSG